VSLVEINIQTDEMFYTTVCPKSNSKVSKQLGPIV